MTPRLALGMSYMPTVCVDTNIWIYSLCRPRTDEVAKHRAAQAAIQSAGKITLTPQIINELGFALRRKHAWSDDDLEPIFAGLLESCALHIPSRHWHLDALRSRRTYALSYWDSLIVAAAVEAGCHTLISEDMQHRQQIGGLCIINSFV